jgi:hypothetical protein
MRKNKTTKHLATENPGTMKKYLMELFVASVSGSNSQHDLYKVAENWGRSEAEADQDIRRVENIECAGRWFVSKAVHENYNKTA